MLFRGILEMLLESCDSYARVGIKGGVVWCRLGWVFINMHRCISTFQVPPIKTMYLGLLQAHKYCKLGRLIKISVCSSN